MSSSRSSNAAWLTGTLSSVYSPPSIWKLRSVVVPRLPVTTYSWPGCTRVPKYSVSGLSRPILVNGPVPDCMNGWSRS